MKKNTWNLTAIFQNDNDPKIKVLRKKVEKTSYSFINKWKDRSDYLSNPAVLKEALDEYENWTRNLGPYDSEVYYFSLRTSQNQLDTKLKARYNQAINLARKIQNEIQFFTLRLAKIPVEKQKKFLSSPLLFEYKHFLESLFKDAKYQLSEPEEKIMNLKHQSSHGNWVKMIGSFLSKEEREGKTFAEIMALLYHRDKLVRDRAAIQINNILDKYTPVAEHEINSILGNKKIDDELRGFSRPDQARHLSDDIDTEVVDTMIQSVAENFSIPRRWYRLKAKLLGLPKLSYHDRNADYGKLTQIYSYPTAGKLVSKVFHALDPEIGQIFDRFTKNDQIDAFPQKGKKDGAFCAAGSLNLPIYILTNHTGKLTDVLTLAHEAGHGVNDELMIKSVNALHFGSPLSTAEVASTFFEDFVLQELLREADDEQKLAIMIKKMDDETGTIFRQVACYRFEQDLHTSFRQKGYLGKNEIGKLFQKHMSAYMGPAVEQSPGSENWWVYWSHIRRFFYVYSYSSGLLISKSLQTMVKKDPAFIAQVKKFLSAGTSKSPKDIFAALGIDIADPDFWNRGLKETEKLLDETEALARKLGKIS